MKDHAGEVCFPGGRIRPGEALGSIPGTVPRLERGFTGCAFRQRCAHAMDACADTIPQRHPDAAHDYLCQLDAA